MRLHDVLQVLEEMAPLRYAESWDNVGLLVGDRAATIRKVLVTVDYTEAVAEEARGGADLVVAYHPPLFSAVKRVPHEALWADAIRRGIALYSPHTALDVAREGTNDVLADACGVSTTDRRPLREHVAKPGRAEPPGIGLGRVGAVTSAASRRDLVARVKEALGLSYVLASGPLDSNAARVAVAAGAGGELLADAIAAGADVFVTGEIRHHDALAAAQKGVTVVATLHSNSERVAVKAFAARLAARLAPLDVAFSGSDADPFTVV
ncbi:MAG: Nif3-like dinuclear metal center hexameric protein [Labilithrix sp.]|nr:Nif3-like dinuclear metal center hexameric protein [Labilithrix sp.]